MLVAFAMTNYTCFRDRQELNMEAVPRASRDDTYAFLITTQAKRNLSSRSGIGGVRSAT